MRFLFLIICSVVIAGCASQEQKAKNYYLNNKDKLAKLCVDCFPPQIEYRPGTPVFLKGDTVVELRTRVDTVEADCPDGTKVKKDCPPCKDSVIYKKLLQVDTIFNPNHPQVHMWKSEYEKAEKKLTELELKYASQKERTSFWKKWALIIGGILLLKVGWRLSKLYTS